jgi:hypothetical protein
VESLVKDAARRDQIVGVRAAGFDDEA